MKSERNAQAFMCGAQKCFAGDAGRKTPQGLTLLEMVVKTKVCVLVLVVFVPVVPVCVGCLPAPVPELKAGLVNETDAGERLPLPPVVLAPEAFVPDPPTPPGPAPAPPPTAAV